MSPHPDNAGSCCTPGGCAAPPSVARSSAHSGRPHRAPLRRRGLRPAAESVPDLSRGTVYATLAEFSELGLLSAFGLPSPCGTRRTPPTCALSLPPLPAHIRPRQRAAEPRGDHRRRFLSGAGRHPRRRHLRRMQRLRRRPQSRSSRHVTIRTRRRHARHAWRRHRHLRRPAGALLLAATPQA